jgi:hypothetical protein
MDNLEQVENTVNIKEKINTNRWIENATQIQQVELLPRRAIGRKTYIQLYENQGEFKFFEKKTGSWASGQEAISIDDLNTYLNSNCTESTKEALIQMRTLVLEKTQLDKSITQTSESKNQVTKI